MDLVFELGDDLRFSFESYFSAIYGDNVPFEMMIEPNYLRNGQPDMLSIDMDVRLWQINDCQPRTMAELTVEIAHDSLLIAAVMHRSPASMVGDGWEFVCRSDDLVSDASQWVTVWKKHVQPGTYTVQARQTDGVRMGMKIISIRGASDVALVETHTIREFPFYPQLKTGCERLYFGTSYYADSIGAGHLCVFPSGNVANLKCAEEKRFSVFLDENLTGPPPTFSFDMRCYNDYTESTASITVLNIIKEE